jgi:putative ABC transport system permease protein
MVLWKFTSREIRNRPGRAILTLLSIVIGVAAVVAVTISTATTSQAYKEMFESVTGKASFEVMPEEDGGWLSPALAQQLEKVPGVETAVPFINRSPYQIRVNGKKPICLLLGIDPKRSEIFDSYQLVPGGEYFQPDSENVALLESGFAKGLGVNVGDEIKIQGRSMTVEPMKVIGLLGPKSAANFNPMGVVFLPLPTAQRVAFGSKVINRVSIVLDKTVDENTVHANLDEAVKNAKAKVVAPASKSQGYKETLQQAEWGLTFAFVLSIFLALFMIFNTFLMNVSERRRQLAILRAIGSTRKQVIRMLLLEGFAMGVVGTLIGCVVGLGGAYLLSLGMTRIFNGAAPSLHITLTPFLLAGFIGPAVSLAGVFVPAYLASHITPLEGMRPVVSETNPKLSMKYIAGSASVFGITALLFTGCILGILPRDLIIPLGVIFTVAFVLIIPVVLTRFTRFAAFVLQPILKTEGQIASRQILRRRVRTTITVGILFIAVSTAVGMGSAIMNNINDVNAWLDKALMGDFFIRPVGSSLAGGASSMPMPDSVGDEIRKVDGVRNVDSVRYVQATVHTPGNSDKKDANVIIRDFTDKDSLPLELKEGSISQVRAGLADGQIVLSTVLANRLNSRAGDELVISTSQGEKSYRIAGTATVYAMGGTVIYMAGDRARELMGVEGADIYAITADPARLAAVETHLKNICDQNGIMLQSLAELRMKVQLLLNGIVGSLWGLMVLGFIVSAFGMANTLSMNVLEQTRELALLRVVAMTRRQVRKTILAQATIIGFIGLVTGTIGGLIGSWTMNLCSSILSGQSVPFAFHPFLVVVCILSGLAVILLAAWVPAERAARLNLLIALQYE